MLDAPDSFYPTLIPVAEELRGPRIVLRRHRADDAADLFAALKASRERLAPWLGFPNQLVSIEATRDFLIRREAKWLLRELLGYAIWHGETQEYLGGVDCTPSHGSGASSRSATGCVTAPRDRAI